MVKINLPDRRLKQEREEQPECHHAVAREPTYVVEGASWARQAGMMVLQCTQEARFTRLVERRAGRRKNRLLRFEDKQGYAL